MKNIETLKYISENSRYVSIDTEKIKLFLNKIENINYNYWLSDNNLNLNEKESILFAFICESMNFCFWENKNWVVNYEGKGYNGACALFYSIMNEISSNPNFLNLDYLLKLNQNELKRILESNKQLPPLLSERYQLLKETINIIACKKEKFYEELFSISSDEELLNYIIKNFKHFDDKSVIDGKTVHFNKRAILLVNDLFHLSNTIRNNIKNLDNLTGGADYAIPRLFREFGILNYNNELLNIIRERKLIEHNSRMEIEIRANTIYVIELIREYLEKKGIYINSIQLDNIIWGIRIENKDKLPVHHTKCLFY